MILLADSGSSKTDWILINESGQTLGEFQTEGLNPFFTDSEKAAKIIQNGVASHLPKQPTRIFFYGAGCVNEVASAPLQEALSSIFPKASLEINSDLLAAARSLCQNKVGLVCILGTGSNNGLYDGESIINQIPSLGFWLGDEGSGGFIGKSLITRFLHKEMPEEILREFAMDYPEVERNSVLESAYKKPNPNRYFAQFARFAAANQTQPYVSDLVKSSFDLFLEKYVLKHPFAKNYEVSFVGSIAYHFRGILAEAVQERGLKLGKIAGRPMGGLVQYHIP